MSKFTRITASLLAILLVFSQIVTVHAASDNAEPTINPKLMGLFMREGNQYNTECLISLSTLEKQYAGPNYHSENFRIQSVVSQLDEHGQPQTYYISTDGWAHVRSTVDDREILRVDMHFRDLQTSFAAAPLAYQNGIYGYMIGTHENTVTLCDVYKGHDRYISLPSTVRVAAITPKTLVGSVAEYYILDTNGIIWTMSISFPSFELVELKEFIRTGISATCDTDALYYDGSWIYMANRDHGSTLTMISPYNGRSYEFRNLIEDCIVYDIFEENVIPLVHKHSWSFVGFEWDKALNGYSAEAVFQCETCGEEQMVTATVTKKRPFFANIYVATVTAGQSPDGHAHSAIINPVASPLPVAKKIVKDTVIGPIFRIHP